MIAGGPEPAEVQNESQSLAVAERQLDELKGVPRFEFDIPDKLTDDVVQPVRVWPIPETVTHLEGFDFIPGTKDEIWHAQNTQVDRYRLDGVGVDVEQEARGTDVETR